MNILKRLEALEAAAQAKEPDELKLEIAFVNPDRSIAGLYRMGDAGLVAVPVEDKQS